MRPGHGGRAQLHGSRVPWLAPRCRIAHARRTRDLQPLACCSSHACGEKIAVKIGLKLQILIDLATSSEFRSGDQHSSVDSVFGVRALIPTLRVSASWGVGGRGAPARITESDHPRYIPVWPMCLLRLLRHLLGSAVTRVGRTARDGSRTSGRRCPPTPAAPARGVEIRFGESAEASLARRFRVLLRPRSDLVGRTFTRHAKTVIAYNI